MEPSRKSLLLMMLLVVATMGQEPQCSRFHYEEQLLAKMVRLEHEFELLEKQSQDLLGKMIARFDSVQQGYEDLKRESTGMQENATTTTLELLELSRDFSAFKVDSEAKTKTKSPIWFLANGISIKTKTTGRTFVFPNTVADESGGYDNKTGEFTAPSDGLYWFSTQICSGPNKKVRFDIVIDGVPMASTLVNEDTSTTCVTSAAFGTMRMGRKACVKPTDTITDAGLADNRFYRSSFSGYSIS